METIRRLGLGSAIALVWVGIGCGEPADSLDDDADTDIEVESGKADSDTIPTGWFFARETGHPGDFVQLVLDDDGSFFRAEVTACDDNTCRQVETRPREGTYRVTRTARARYIRFRDQGGNELDRYAYRQTAVGLDLRRVHTRRWVALKQDQCRQDGDCGPYGTCDPRGCYFP